MQYELKSVKAIGNPYTRKDKDGQEQYGINILITTGIVGQTYKGFTNTDSSFFELEKGQTINQNEAEMNAFATQFVSEKYPNT